MPEYSSYEELVSSIEKTFPKILEDYVTPVMTEILKQHIYTDIYQVYTPVSGGWVNGTTYKRRRNLPNSLYSIVKSDGDGVLAFVTSDESFTPIIKGHHFDNNCNPGAFLEMLEKGNMGIWKIGFPRPAVSNAQKEIDTSYAIKEAIQKGLDSIFG